MRFASAYLVLGGLVTLGFGIVYLVRSERMARLVGIRLTSAPALADYRAIYGGAQVALGLFFLLAAWRGWIVPGLAAVGMFATGFGLARLATLAGGRVSRDPQWIVGALEVGAGAGALWLAAAA